MMARLLCIPLAATCLISQAAEPRMPHEACIEEAAIYHKVNAKTLKAIIFQESSGNPNAIHRNINGTADLGAAGINSVHLKDLAKYGLDARSLMNGCTNAYVGAWLYAKKIKKYGNSWKAVGAYHSETPHIGDPYSILIQLHLVHWGYLPKAEWIPVHPVAKKEPKPEPQWTIAQTAPPSRQRLEFGR